MSLRLLCAVGLPPHFLFLLKGGLRFASQI